MVWPLFLSGQPTQGGRHFFKRRSIFFAHHFLSSPPSLLWLFEKRMRRICVLVFLILIAAGGISLCLTNEFEGEVNFVLITSIMMAVILTSILWTLISRRNKLRWSQQRSEEGTATMSIKVHETSLISEVTGPSEYRSMESTPRNPRKDSKQKKKIRASFTQMPNVHTHQWHVQMLEQFLKLLVQRPHLLEKRVHRQRLLHEDKLTKAQNNLDNSNTEVIPTLIVESV